MYARLYVFYDTRDDSTDDSVQQLPEAAIADASQRDFGAGGATQGDRDLRATASGLSGRGELVRLPYDSRRHVKVYANLDLWSS